MPKIVENQDGAEETLYTPEEVQAEADRKAAEKEAAVKAEYEAKLAEKDEHHKKKLDEFVQGKKGIDEKEKEWNEKIETTKKTADEALTQLQQEKAARLNTVKEFMFEGYGATDPEIKKKLQEEYDLLNMPATTDEEIKARTIKAARNAGLASGAPSGFSVPMGGGYAPTFKRDEGLKDSDHDSFLKETGLGDFGKLPEKNKQ